MADPHQSSSAQLKAVAAFRGELERALDEEDARAIRPGRRALRRLGPRAVGLALGIVLLAAAAVGAATGWLSVGTVIPAEHGAPPGQGHSIVVATGSTPVGGPWRMEVYRSGTSTDPETGVVYEPPKLPCIRIWLLQPPAATLERGAGQCGHFARAPGFGFSSIRVSDGAGRAEHVIFGRAPKRAAFVRMTAPGGIERVVATRPGPARTGSDFWLIVAPAVHGEATLRWRAADRSTAGKPLHVPPTSKREYRALPPSARKTPGN